MKIKDIEIKNNLVLAPMAGVCNYSFRSICKKLGAGLVVTEMISSHAIYYKNKKTLEMLKSYGDEYPVAVQLFGDNIEYLVHSAKYIEKNTNFNIIDINCGCPVPKIAVRSNAGAGLMKYPNKIYEIVKALVENSNLPITIKIRSGWDDNNKNAVEIAKLAEKAGASAIFIHGRTRKQAYSGTVDLDIIKQVKESVNIPVIGNGDVCDYESYKKMMDYTGVDGVMIGRASLGNPWVFHEISSKINDLDYEKPGVIEIKKMILDHFYLLKEIKGIKLALLEMRGIGIYYLKGLRNTRELKEKIIKSNTEKDFVEAISSFFDNY